MPLKKSPLTLEELCFNAIVDNFDELRFQISALPYFFINKLYENRDDFKTQQPLLATIFINPGTRRLKLQKEFTHHTDWVVNRIQTLCKNLTYLDLTDVIEISPQQLSSLVKNLAELKQIILTGTTCNDDVLNTIGDHCQKLRNLDVSNCPISNVGLLHLCAHNSSIEVLNIEGTDVTTVCCLHILDNVENLKEFAHSKWKTVFQIMKQRFSSEQKWRTYNLEVLSDTDQQLILPELKIHALDIFPKLRRLIMGYQYGLLEVDVYPPLRNAGRGLTSLELRYAKFDIDVLGHSCPNLEILELCQCKRVHRNTKSMTMKTFAPSFPKLYALYLQYSFVDIVTLLLSAPNLEELYLVSCYSFIDDVLTPVLDSNGLKQLQEFRVKKCDEITSSALMKLLMVGDLLNVLDISKCRNINERDFEELNTYVEEKNLDVLVTYERDDGEEF